MLIRWWNKFERIFPRTNNIVSGCDRGQRSCNDTERSASVFYTLRYAPLRFLYRAVCIKFTD